MNLKVSISYNKYANVGLRLNRFSLVLLGYDTALLVRNVLLQSIL